MSKVIYKQMFKHPNFKNTNQSNVGHVKYIGTRAGVDKSMGADGASAIDEQLKLKINQLEDTNIFNESDFDEELKYESMESLHLKYLDERPNSHGLFGQVGKEDLLAVQEEIKGVNSFVWRSIISLKEEDAQVLGYLDKASWQDMLRDKMPVIATTMNIPIDNLRWVGAVHMEKGHPHVHVMFWEKTPKLKHGILPKAKLESIRKLLTDNIFHERREYLLTEKNAIRQLIVEEGEQSMSSLLIGSHSDDWFDQFASDITPKHVGARIFAEDEEHFRGRIEALSEMIPDKGRKAYGYMPADVKEVVDGIVDDVCMLPQFESLLARNELAVRGLVELYTSKEDDINTAVEKSTKDLKKRLAQTILKSAIAYKTFGKYTVSQDKLEKSLEGFIKHKDVFQHRYEKLLKAERVFSFLRLYVNDDDLLLENIETKLGIKLTDEEREKCLNVNSEYKFDQRELKDIVVLLRDFGFTEDDIYHYIRSCSQGELEELKTFWEQGEVDGLPVSLAIKYRVDLKALDISIIHAINESALLFSQSDFESLFENDNIKDVLYAKRQGFEIKAIDKRIVDLFSHINAERDGKYVITEKDIRDKLVDDVLKSNDLDELLSEPPDNISDDFNLTYNIIMQRIETLKLNGWLEYDRENNVYLMSNDNMKAISEYTTPFKFGLYDATYTFGFFDDGVLDKATLIEKLTTKYPDIKEKDLDKKTRSLLWKLKKLDEKGVISSNGDVYRITDYGHDKQKDLLEPTRVTLKSRLNYLVDLGVITTDGIGYNVNQERVDLLSETSNIEEPAFKKLADLYKLHDGILNFEAVKETRNYYINRSFYANDFKEETLDLNSTFKIPNYVEKSLKTLSVMSVLNGRDQEQFRAMFEKDIDNTTLSDSDISLAYQVGKQEVEKALKFGQTPFVSQADYEEAYKLFGISEENIPDYFNSFSRNPNDFHKSINLSGLFSVLENEARKEEYQNQLKVSMAQKRLKNKLQHEEKKATKSQGQER